LLKIYHAEPQKKNKALEVLGGFAREKTQTLGEIIISNRRIIAPKYTDYYVFQGYI